MAGSKKKKKTTAKAGKKSTPARKVVRKKEPDADFGVYFQITNGTSNVIELVNFISNNGDCTQIDPSTYGSPIPNDGKPHQIHFRDPCGSTGADGNMTFQGRTSGKLYKWAGACPVWSPTNTASGPGIQNYNSGGHPLTVTIFINDSTPPTPPAKKK